MKHRPEPSSLVGEDEEENFFVSLSDLMTGVLFIFVILTTALALHYHLKAAELETAKGDAIGARGEAEKAKGDAEDAKGKARQVQEALDALAKVLREREQLRKVELQQLVARLREQNLAVELDGTNGILSLPEKLLFRTGEAKLQPDGEAALTLLAREILPVALMGCGNSPLKWEAIYIEGHTDNIPIRTAEFASNWQLASARAISTFTALALSQPALGTLHNHQQKAVFGISGYGEQRPVAANATEEGRQKNRRIDIRFVMAYPSESEIQAMEQQLKQASQSMEGEKK
jgi:flagellar motor protein MotB